MRDKIFRVKGVIVRYAITPEPDIKYIGERDVLTRTGFTITEDETEGSELGMCRKQNCTTKVERFKAVNILPDNVLMLEFNAATSKKEASP